MSPIYSKCNNGNDPRLRNIYGMCISSYPPTKWIQMLEFKTRHDAFQDTSYQMEARCGVQHAFAS